MGFPVVDQLINGHVFDFSTIEAQVGPRIITRFTAVNYEHGVEQGTLRGTTPFMLGTTRGQYNASGSFTIYTEEWDLLTSALLTLQNPPGGAWMEKRFPIIVTYAEPTTKRLLVDELIGCRITRVRRGHSAGADPLTLEVDISINRIIENGKPAILDNTQQP